MFKKFLPKSESARNILTLMMGTSVAQALPIAISPILTRLYTPEDFGVLAIFVSITAIFGVIANGRYELAVMLPERDEDALSVVVLGVLIALLLSVLLLVLVVLFNEDLARILGNKEIGVWLYFVPVTVFFMGLFNALSYYSNRQRDYKLIAKATVQKSLVMAVIQLVLGVTKFGAGGLVLGQAASSVLANAQLVGKVFNKSFSDNFSQSSLLPIAKRYRNFPLYSMWGVLANSLSVNAVNILISSVYSVGVLGFYSFVQRVLGMPASLIGNSVGRVFYQRAMEERRTHGHARSSFDAALKKLLLIGVPIFLVFYFIVEPVFGIAFGKEWAVAGAYAKILMPFFFFRFVGASLSNTNNVFEKQGVALAWQIGLLIISFSILLCAKFLGLDFEFYLYLNSAILSFYYFYLILLLRNVSRGDRR